MTTFTLPADPAPASKTVPVSGRSPARSRQNQNFGGLSTSFRALSMRQKAGWQTAANARNTALGRTGRRKLTALNAYKLYNSGRLARGVPASEDAPTGNALNLPPPLPKMGLTVTRSTDTDVVTVTLFAETGIAHPVQVLAALPQILGKPTWPDRAFSPAGFVDGLPSGPSDISAMVARFCGAAEAGSEIGLRLVAMSEAGLRREFVLATAECTDAPHLVVR